MSYKWRKKEITKQLNSEQRDVIQVMLANHYNFTEIAKVIQVDRTTVSKEIRRNRYLKSDNYKHNIEMIKKVEDNCNLLKKPPYVCNFCPKLRYCIKNKVYNNAKVANKHSDNI